MGDDKAATLKVLHSLLKDNGILSLALYGIERIIPVDAKPTPKGFYSTVLISHEEAIKPFLELFEFCGFRQKSIIKNGGVHFDDFHDSSKWRKYGEVFVSSLERKNIYNFVKI